MIKLNRIKPVVSKVLIYDSLGVRFLQSAIPEGMSSSTVTVRDQYPFVVNANFIVEWGIGFLKTNLTLRESYITALLDQFQPKVVLSFSDLDGFLGKYSKVRPNVLVVTIQNALRYPWELDQINRFPVLYALGNATVKALETRNISSDRTESVGSLPLGIVCAQSSELKRTNDIIFVSSYRAWFDETREQDSYEALLSRAHRCIFLNLLRYAKEFDVPVTVLAKGKVRLDGEHFFEEQQYFDRLSQGQQFRLSSTVKDTFKSYDIALSASVVIALDSTLAYEVLSVGGKVLLGWGVEKKLEEMGRYFNQYLVDEILLRSHKFEHFREKLDCLRALPNDKYEDLISDCRSVYVSQDLNYPPHIRLQNEILGRV